MLMTCARRSCRQGSTIIEFLVNFPDGEVPDRVALAQELLNFRTNGFPFEGTNYDVSIDPLLKDGTVEDTLSTSACL